MRYLFILVIIAVNAHAGRCGAEEPLVLRLGVTLPLTGPAAAYGIAVRNGIELARARDPLLFSRMEIHYADSQLVPTHAISAFNSVHSRASMSAHFDFGSATSLALAPIAEKRRIVLFSSAYDPRVSRGREYVIRFANSTVDYASTLLAALRQRGVRRFALVVADNPFFVEYAQTFQALLHSDERLTIYSIKPDESDHAALILKLQQARSEDQALGLFVFVEQAEQLVRRFRMLDKDTPLFGTDAFEEVFQSPRQLTTFEGLQFANSAVEPDFLANYWERYSELSHHTFAAGAFDLVRMLAEISLSCVRCDQDEILAAVQSGRARKGALGGFQFTESSETGKHFSSRIVMKEVPYTTIDTHSKKWTVPFRKEKAPPKRTDTIHTGSLPSSYEESTT